MAKVAPITGLSVTHFHTDEYEERNEYGILTKAFLKYRWTNGSNTYSKIEVVYTKWENSKWNQKSKIELPGNSTSWDYDILGTEWTPFNEESPEKYTANKSTPNIVASFTAYEIVGGKEVKSSAVKVTYTFTKVDKIVLPTVDNEQVVDDGVNKWRFKYELDLNHMSDADKKAYNNTIIYRARCQNATVLSSKAKNAQTAFNKTNYPPVGGGKQQTLYSKEGHPLGGNTDLIDDEEGYYEWFRVFYDTLAGTSKNYSSIFADSSGPLAPLINDKSSKIELTKMILKYTIQANQDHACNILRIERCFGMPSSATLNYTLKELSLPVPEEWTLVKTINPSKKYSNETRTDTIDIGVSPGLDEVVWVKMIAKNGSGSNSSIESAPVCLGGFALTSPQIISLEKSEIGYEVSVFVKNNSKFPNVRVAVVESNGQTTTSIGVLDGTETSESQEPTPWRKTFKYIPPAVDEQGQPKEVKFGVIAFFGKDYKNAVLKSSIVNYQEGETPTPITDVNISPADGITGAITVSWKTSWTGATGAEISWSDHEDAWNSNEGPNTATVTTLESNPSFNIRGLTAGNWYIQIRATKDGGTTYSPYERASQWPFKYSSTPDTTQVSLAPDHISVGQANTITASWAYKNSDDSTQKSATLYEVYVGKSVVTGYYYNGKIYTSQAHSTEIPGAENTIYKARTDYNYTESTEVENIETASFTLSHTVNSIVSVTVNGVAVVDGYTVEQNVITFDTPLEVGSDVEVSYIHITEDAQYEWDSENGFYYLEKGYEIINGCAYREIGHVDNENTSIELAPWENDNWRTDPASVFKDWKEGTTHLIVVETTSSTNLSSSFDYIRDNDIAGTLTIEESALIPSDFKTSNIDIFKLGFNDGKLVDMPIFIKLSDFQNGDNIVEQTDNVKLVISRNGDLISPNRPDNSTNDGFDKETIFSTYISGSELESYTINEGTESEVTYTGGILITNDDLVGHFDDGCSYFVDLVITRNKMKSSTDPDVGFTVEWLNQAKKPSNSTTFQEVIDNDTGDIQIQITPVSSHETPSDSVFDIYRLTKDKPKLIVEGGQYGQSFIDPYPSNDCKYRIVDRTPNGDWIEGNTMGAGAEPAWVDFEHGIDISYHGLVINFEDPEGEVRINTPLDVTLSNSWTKDFQSTKYLNGHIVGDWNSGVERKLSANSKYVKDISKVIDQDKENILDEEFVNKIRRLANHAGICHVRTIDGSSITADVQVSEDNNSNEETFSYSFDISEVESEELDGVLYEEE